MGIDQRYLTKWLGGCNCGYACIAFWIPAWDAVSHDAATISIDAAPNSLPEEQQETPQSFWPGQPVHVLSSSAEDNKLVRIDDKNSHRKHPMDNPKRFLMDNLDEFLDVYKNRPDKTNTCGIRINHSLAIYMIAKILQPTTIIESGINSGQSTYFFRSACPNAKIISIDPEPKPICGQPVRWIDSTNNEYLTGENFTDFDNVNWGERIRAGQLDPATTLVFVDDHRGFFKRFSTFARYGFRHLINEDNYKLGEGATRADKMGLTPKQMFRQPQSPDTVWLFHNLMTYREFPPLVPPSLTEGTPHIKKPQGGFLHHTDDLVHIEEPLLRPEINDSDKELYETIAFRLNLDASNSGGISILPRIHGILFHLLHGTRTPVTVSGKGVAFINRMILDQI